MQENKKPYGRGILGYTNSYKQYGQTDPPTITVEELFPNQNFPVGELQYYNNSITSQDNNDDNDILRKLRHASEVHRQVRRYSQSFIKPGIHLIDICEKIEEMNRFLVKENGLEAGIAFPTGCSVNNIAAHFTPNPKQKYEPLREDDVISIDFGTQISGKIIDCAWSMAFNPKYDSLLEAVKESTNVGIQESGLDARLCEIGERIQETMESHEVEINSKTIPIKCVQNLCGHSIIDYKIHGSKRVPTIKNSGITEKMEEGEIYAIETFGTTGRGYVVESGECSHFMKSFDERFVPLRIPRSKKLLCHINKTFGTLAFCPRWLERDDGGSRSIHKESGKQENYIGALNDLCKNGIINKCPPLVDVENSYVAQYEHTIILREHCKEILSRGDDY